MENIYEVAFHDDIDSVESILKDLSLIVEDVINENDFKKKIEFEYIDNECDTGKGIMRWTERYVSECYEQLLLSFLVEKISLSDIQKLKSFSCGCDVFDYDLYLEFEVKDLIINPHNESSIKLDIIMELT